jgi:hypothetical protein
MRSSWRRSRRQGAILRLDRLGFTTSRLHPVGVTELNPLTSSGITLELWRLKAFSASNLGNYLIRGGRSELRRPYCVQTVTSRLGPLFSFYVDHLFFSCISYVCSGS